MVFCKQDEEMSKDEGSKAALGSMSTRLGKSVAGGADFDPEKTEMLQGAKDKMTDVTEVKHDSAVKRRKDYSSDM